MPSAAFQAPSPAFLAISSPAFARYGPNRAAAMAAIDAISILYAPYDGKVPASEDEERCGEAGGCMGPVVGFYYDTGWGWGCQMVVGCECARVGLGCKNYCLPASLIYCCAWVA